MTAGVTGGIGSGKSTVCAMFGRWGAHVIDADRAAREAVDEPGALGELVERFGRGIVDAAGNLDRRAVGRVAFADDASRQKLTDVVWPRVGRRLKAETESALRTDPKWTVVIEAPLLLEWGDPDGLCETVVVVTAPEAIRIARTMARQGLAEEEVRARMRHQMPEEQKVSAADYVIDNDADLATLEVRARSVWDEMVSARK